VTASDAAERRKQAEALCETPDCPCGDPTLCGTADPVTACPNSYCKGGWVERGDNESGGAPAFQCRAEGCPHRSHAASERDRLRALAIAARDAFPRDDWTHARHMSRASFAYVVGVNDAAHSDPTGAFCDAVTPDVVLALLDELEVDRA
jgi:hypothetical protein